MTEFWNSEITRASWEKLQELNKEFEFTLIGGWAVYLYTKLQKSKDIDVVVDYPVLRHLEGMYRLDKNERLHKYEVKLDLFYIDIYLPGYSRLTLPAKDLIGRYATHVEGFKVPTAEALLLLKLGAAADRLPSQKGAKDAIDLLGLLFYSGADVEKLKEIAVEHGLVGHVRLLGKILDEFRVENLKYLGLNKASFSKLRRKYAEIIRKSL